MSKNSEVQTRKINLKCTQAKQGVKESKLKILIPINILQKDNEKGGNGNRLGKSPKANHTNEAPQIS